MRERIATTDSLLHQQARLLGVSGLLPEDLTRKQRQADGYLRTVWDHWWRERDAFADCVLPRSLWRLQGLRPANHPHRRLALAAHWQLDAGLGRRLERWFTESGRDTARPESLLPLLQPGPDEFWSRHWTLRSATMPRPQPLLGLARVTDLAINVILPWLWVRAREGGQGGLMAEAERRYLAWPNAEDNVTLRQARERLLGGRSINRLDGAAAQQGLMQVVRDFCEQSDALCAGCAFPELIRAWTVQAG